MSFSEHHAAKKDHIVFVFDKFEPEEVLDLLLIDLLCPFGKAAQIRKISVNVHKKEDNRPIQQNVLRFVSDKNESGTII